MAIVREREDSTFSILMKVFCFIFSVYLLVLSVQPCQDLGGGEFSYPKNGNEQTLLNDGDAPEQETHECSPFCICSCRQVSTSSNLTVLSIAEETEGVAATSQAKLYQNNYSNQYLNSIWQPPKFNFTA